MVVFVKKKKKGKTNTVKSSSILGTYILRKTYFGDSIQSLICTFNKYLLNSYHKSGAIVHWDYISE